ncbi:MAG: succinylglutamate desuccinylase/aspartoacylase family protein, partial [Patescibacteria group bacterium]|nr:succinylglutamate desuccinylase/aspartoacylase family protein [Patescibacteria group bacterium]
MNNIIFITGQHGDEPIPILALSSKNVPQIIGNPKALCINKRFLDCDLNNSFGVKSNTSCHEHKRAEELLKIISFKKNIIDFHTFSAESEPFVVIVDKKMIRLAYQAGLKHIVLMEHNIKNGHALINYRNGISVEVGKHNDYESFLTTLKVLDNIKS